MSKTRFHFVVPTTGGPNAVRALTQRRDLPASVVFQNSNFRPLSWSLDYDQFLLPSGPVRSLISGVTAGAFVLRVDDDIDGGRSWEVPTLLLHFCAAAGHIISAKLSESDVLVWSTGALDFDDASDLNSQKITPQDYALQAKIEASRDLFKQAADNNIRLIVLLPIGHGTEDAAKFVSEILTSFMCKHHIICSSSLGPTLMCLTHDADVHMTLPVVETPKSLAVTNASHVVHSVLPQAIIVHSTEGNVGYKRTSFVAAGLIAGACIIGLSAYAFMGTAGRVSRNETATFTSPPVEPATTITAAAHPVHSDTKDTALNREAVQPVKPGLVVHELRAMDGMSCLDMIVQDMSFIRKEVPVENDKPINSVTKNVCGFDYGAEKDILITLDKHAENLALRKTIIAGSGNTKRLVLSNMKFGQMQQTTLSIKLTVGGLEQTYQHVIRE